jgi:peptidoglycan/xylan/chitin deacetylase (PgdA/CDA1 family)
VPRRGAGERRGAEEQGDGVERQRYRVLGGGYQRNKRPRRPLRVALPVLALLAAIVIVLFALHGRTPARSSPRTAFTSTTAGVRADATPAPTTTTLPSPPPVPARAPIFSEGVWLPVTLPASASAVVLPILQYHAVDVRPIPGSWGKRLTLSTARFQAEMDYLVGAGYHPVTLERVYARMAHLRPLPGKPVALTFDDGYRDNYTVAFPILRAHHFLATFFVITAAVGRPGYLTWADLRLMHAAGMAIESHTVHHENLDVLSAPRLATELAQSRAAIAAELGQIPAVLAYPGGDYNLRVAAATRSAGYLMAVLTHSGSRLNSSNTYLWPRMAIGANETPSGFTRALGGITRARSQSTRAQKGSPRTSPASGKSRPATGV